MKKKHTVLLTGGSGFIGRHLQEKLLGTGFKVLSLGRKGSAQVSHDLVESVEVDLVGPELASRLRALPEFEAVIHLAANPKLGQGEEQVMKRLHVEAPLVLAHAAAMRGARFLHVSTAYVVPDPRGHLQEGPAVVGVAANAYEKTKTAGELALIRSRTRHIEILRPGVVLPEEHDSTKDLLESPLGAFLRVAKGIAGKRLPFAPSARVPLPLCRRRDIADFVIGRLEAEIPARIQYWNMIAPYPLSVCEALASMGMTSGGTERMAFMEPWRPYLEGSRTWDIAGYFCECVRQKRPVLPVSQQELKSIAQAVAATLTHPEGGRSHVCSA